MSTTAQCDVCHTSQKSWKSVNFDHGSAGGNCSSCHNGSAATGKSSSHFVTTMQCDSCHRTSAWEPLITYQHLSGSYPGNHGKNLSCKSCHKSNSQIADWKYPAYKLSCAGCHANDYERDEHRKTDNPRTYYTVSELRDCSGSCHRYADSSMNKRTKTRSSEHRVSKRGW